MSAPPDDDSTTLPSLSEQIRSVAVRPAPQLLVLLEEERPPQRTRIVPLEAYPDTVLGRGGAPASASEPVPRLGLQDRWLSTQHARLSNVRGRVTIEDLGSKNGTAVNGSRTEKRLLLDGNLIGLGHSLLVFRSALPPCFPPTSESLPGFATISSTLGRQLSAVRSIATSKVTLLIQGETGTGKELIARGVHTLSGATGAFVAVNCGALPATLLEAELFGYRKGAFSGALKDHPGLIRAADNGTLFLDEIGDLPPAGQAALLRALQECEVRPIGEVKAVKVNFRLLAATHHNLQALVDAGRFRKDLFARLGGHVVDLPPLRARMEDLPLLMAMLLARHGDARTEPPRLSNDAGRAFYRYQWPLNVRELERCLEAAVALAGDGVIELEHLPDAVRQSVLSVATRVERELSDEDSRRKAELDALLEQHGGNITAVAAAMGKARVQIRRWIKRYGL